jgi:two-component system cell cycle response regulator
MLSSEPYNILQAESGEKALEVINNQGVDLVLLDVMMPGLNGFEVTRILKNNPGTKHIPIILVTALDGSENKLKAAEVGADEFLTKPVNKIEIIARIKSILKLKQYQEQLNVRIKIGEELALPSKILTIQQQPQIAVQNSHQQQTVMLVEDDAQYIKLYRSLLSSEPYNFIIATSGEEAIRIGKQCNIDLLLLDIMLPGISGYDVCSFFRNNLANNHLQIVAITSLSDLESRVKGIEKGVDDYLIKPFNNKEIKTRINALLRKKLHFDQLNAHHKEVLNLAITDGLTGLYNQTYFKNYLQLEIERSVERGYLVALIMLDLDDFKRCNDILGHPAGDSVLRQFGEVIKSNIRDIDLPARYGGEEFAVVMPYASKSAALEIAEKIRVSLQNLPIVSDEQNRIGNITTSIGIALCPLQSSSLNGLIEKADYMLYHAKKSGKNKVLYWD